MQYELNLRDYVRIFQKRKWTIILMPILAGLIGFFAAPRSPVVFEATGKLRVSKSGTPTQSILMDLYFSYELGNYLQTHSEVIISQAVLRETAENLGLIPRGLTPDEIRDNEFYLGQLRELGASIVAAPIEATSIIGVTASHSTPNDAIRSVNTLIDTYVDWHRRQLNRQVTESREYIDTQLSDYREVLKRAEDELTEFKLDNAESISLLPYEVGETQQSLENVENTLHTLELQVSLLDQALETGTIPSLDLLGRLSADAPRMQKWITDLSELQRRRQELLVYQTPASPEVKAIDEQIGATVSNLRSELISSTERLQNEQAQLMAKFQVLPGNDVQLARLEREVRAYEQIVTLLNEEYQRARLRESEQPQEVTIIEHAVTASVVPQTGRSARALVAVIIGLLLGVVTALVAETLDTSIGAIEDVEMLLDLSVIGIIPPIDFRHTSEILAKTAPQILDHPNLKRLSALVTHYDPRSPVAEAYRALRTNVEQERERVGGRTIIVTSSVLEEGKTTTSANLALAYAQMGRKTLLVAADTRRADLHQMFALEKEPGFVDVLSGSLPWESAVRGLSDMLLGDLSMDIVMLTPGLDNLHIIPAGATPLNPAELLGSEATGDLMRDLRQAFDVIITDTPPIIPVTDTAVMAEHADGVLLVYEVGKIGRDVLKRAKAHLDAVHAPIWGIVMNDVKAEADTALSDTDYYYYSYRYERTEPQSGLRDRLADTAAKLLGSRRR